MATLTLVEIFQRIDGVWSYVGPKDPAVDGRGKFCDIVRRFRLTEDDEHDTCADLVAMQPAPNMLVTWGRPGPSGVPAEYTVAELPGEAITHREPNEVEIGNTAKPLNVTGHMNTGDFVEHQAKMTGPIDPPDEKSEMEVFFFRP